MVTTLKMVSGTSLTAMITINRAAVLERLLRTRGKMSSLSTSLKGFFFQIIAVVVENER